MDASGCVKLGYMLLRPELMGKRPAAAAAAAAAAAELTPFTDSGARRWLRNFSSRRHLARRLLNHTCNSQFSP